MYVQLEWVVMWLSRAMCPRTHCSGFYSRQPPWVLLNLEPEPLVEGLKQLKHCFIHGEYLLIYIHVYLYRHLYQKQCLPSFVSVPTVRWAGWLQYSLSLSFCHMELEWILKYISLLLFCSHSHMNKMDNLKLLKLLLMPQRAGKEFPFILSSKQWRS